VKDSWITPFLRDLAATGAIVKCAIDAGTCYATVRKRYKTDADFAAAYDIALQEHGATCEAELTRRAFGYDEIVVHAGQLSPVFERDEHGQIVMGARETADGKPEHYPVQARNADGTLQWLTVRKHSDTLLLAKVKAIDKRYSTERTELTGADGGALDVKVMDRTAKAARVAALMAVAAKRKSDADEFGDLA
jgi:hypothetical protein